MRPRASRALDHHRRGLDCRDGGHPGREAELLDRVARDRGGRFRTHGRQSQATVRGTRWVTIDRCDGTLTRVTEGAVVVRTYRTGRRAVVRAGHSHLARPRKARRR